MLVFRIISTVIMGIVCFLAFIISCAVSSGRHEVRNVCISTAICWTVLSFVIVTLWII